MTQTVIVWILEHADKLLYVVGTFLLGLIGRIQWRQDLLKRVAQATGSAFMEVEQAFVVPAKEASADGHLTLAEAKHAFGLARAKAKSLLSIGTAWKILLALLGAPVEKWITAHLETLALTTNKGAVLPSKAVAIPLGAQPSP